jgi:hypothetical protein
MGVGREKKFRKGKTGIIPNSLFYYRTVKCLLTPSFLKCPSLFYISYINKSGDKKILSGK